MDEAKDVSAKQQAEKDLEDNKDNVESAGTEIVEAIERDVLPLSVDIDTVISAALVPSIFDISKVFTLYNLSAGTSIMSWLEVVTAPFIVNGKMDVTFTIFTDAIFFS